MNEIRLGFAPVFPIGLTLGFVTVTLAFLVWLEVRKKQKFVGARVAALLSLSVSILGLVLQPSLLSTQKRGAVLLTPGYDKSKLDSLLKLGADLKILRFGLAEPFSNSEELKSTSTLSHENVKYILGEGVPQYILEGFNKSSFVFLPARVPYGIIELNIPELFSDRKNFISGVFNAQYATKLKLVGPAGTEDSTLIAPGKKSFTLSFTSKHPGLFSYQLESEDNVSQKTIERLPIEIKPQIKLRILFLQDFPTGEFRHLKNFLGEMSHSVVVRTRASKNNFDEEFMNTPKFVLKNISSDLLNRFDLVLADSKTLESLTTLEKSNLKRAVQDGLGLIVFHDTFSKKNEFYSVGGKEITIDTAHLQIGPTSYALPALPIEVKIDGLKSVLKNKKRVLAGYQFFGAGKIGFQLLQETFRLKQQGHGIDYATIWSTLLEKVSRQGSNDFELKVNSFYPYYTDDLIPFSVIASEKIPVVFSDGIKIPLQENVIIDDYWHGKTWAGIPGWHQLRAADTTTLNYFVHEPSSWKPYRGAYSIKQTLLASTEYLTIDPQVTKEQRAVPKILFYLFFLLAAGFLWLAPKI